MNREFTFAVSSASELKTTCTSRKTGRSCSRRKPYRWKIRSAGHDDAGCGVLLAIWRRLRFRNRRTPGKLLEERVPEIAQMLDADLAREVPIGGELAQE